MAAANAPPAIRTRPFRNFRTRPLEYNGPQFTPPNPTNLAAIAIGWFGPSDAADPRSGDLWWATRLAIRQANAHGGCRGKPVRLIPVWSKDPWGTGVAQLFRLVYEQRVLAILGGVDGPSTHLAEQVVAKACLPLVSPVSTDVSINLAGVAWTFSCAPGDDQLAAALTETMARQMASLTGDRSIVLLAATDHDSRCAARAWVRNLARKQLHLDFRFDLRPGSTIAPRQLADLSHHPPRSIMVIAGPEDAGRWVKDIRKLLPDTRIFGTHTLGRHRFREVAGAAADTVQFVQIGQLDASQPDTRCFVQHFRAHYGRDPDCAAALTYDATRLLLAAIEQAGPNRARIRQALAQLSPWPGVAGTIQWDGTGRNIVVSRCALSPNSE